MPCRCCNTDGDCVTSADCAAGYSCCMFACSPPSCTVNVAEGATWYISPVSTFVRGFYGSYANMEVLFCGVGTTAETGVLAQWSIESYDGSVPFPATSGSATILAAGAPTPSNPSNQHVAYLDIPLPQYPSTWGGYRGRFTVRVSVASPSLTCISEQHYLLPELTGSCCVGSACYDFVTRDWCRESRGVYSGTRSCSQRSCGDSEPPVPPPPGGATATLRVVNQNQALDNQWDIYWNNSYVGRYSGDPAANSAWTVNVVSSNRLQVARAVCNDTDDYFLVTVGECGFSSPVAAPRDCPAPAERTFTVNCVLPLSVSAMAASSGPGTEMKALLAKVGITATPTCSCNQRAKEMDDKGVQWCKDNEELILSWLKEEAAKRGLPFISLAAKLLIRRAIRNAEKKANNP